MIVWNNTFENKLVAKDHRAQNKWAEYKIFELKYAYKYNQVRLVLSVFASTCCLYLVSI